MLGYLCIRVIPSRNSKMCRTDSGKQNSILLLNKCVHMLARTFGFWLYHIDFNQMTSSSAVSIKIYDWLGATTAIAVYFFCIYLQCISVDYLISFNFSTIEMIIYQITTSCGACTSIITVILNLVHRNILWRIILIFYYFDEEV